MTAPRARVWSALRRRLRMPLAWYVCFVLASSVVIVGVTVSGRTELALTALAVAAVPLVVAQLLVSARLPVQGTAPKTVLPRLVVWGARLVWTGFTFALGAFVATLVAVDLENVGSGASANDYFFRFVAIILSCVALVAVTGILLAAAWSHFNSDPATRSRAALRALTTHRTRTALSLRMRIWLDGSADEPMPALDSHPRSDHTARALSSETGAVLMLAGTFLFVGLILMEFPHLIALIP